MTSDPFLRSGLKPHEIPADFVVDQRFDAYSPPITRPGRGCIGARPNCCAAASATNIFEGLAALGIAADGIPDFRDLNRVLKAATGWEVVAVPGLVPDRVFFTHLAGRRFPAGFWIRRPEEFDYIEEPDIFHDVFGHVPLLMNPAYADFVAAYGEAGLAAAAIREDLARLATALLVQCRIRADRDQGRLAHLRRRHRLLARRDASSRSRARRLNRIGFDTVRVMRTRYRIDDYQQSYFVLPGFEAMPALDEATLQAAMAQARAKADIDPDVVLAARSLVPARRRQPSSARRRSPPERANEQLWFSPEIALIRGRAAWPQARSLRRSRLVARPTRSAPAGSAGRWAIFRTGP